MDSALGQGEQRIREAVVSMLETDGYDAIQMREVARRARVSLTKIYKLHGTRDELILAALDCWMRENRYAGLSSYTARPGEPLHTALMRVLRPIFEPWEHHPGLLIAYFRARAAAGGETLINHGLEAVVPAAMTALADIDPEFIQDLDAILTSLVYGLLGRVAGGEIEVTAIVPAVDRAVYWMTTGYEAARGHQ
ncbi:TetR family transcriptional regulator [Nocardia carnea]|uniref:TetR family transcriptional regulator n=1 Tax=Nocardia carnea TaxID=37328 RepID=UPI0024565621|nr:TetR family transcriptional regulator [Nocardia carnea]